MSLEVLSFFEKCVCSNCGTPHDRSPKGMYKYTDETGQSSKIICAICVLYKGIHKDLLASQERSNN